MDLVLSTRKEEMTQEVRRIMAVTYISGFRALLRKKLWERMALHKTKPDILRILISTAPRWNGDDAAEDVLHPLAAAAIYRDSNRVRSGNKRGRGGANRFRTGANITPIRSPAQHNSQSPGMILNTKRVDRPQRRRRKEGPCNGCGAATACNRDLCPAKGKICARCNKPNHYTAVCHSPHAVVPPA